MNPQFPVPLNENKLNESDVKEMPDWFKTPLDYINKIAETLFYAQEINLEKEILSKIPSSDFEGYLDSLGGSDGDMLSKISGGYDFTPPLDVESYLDSLGGSDGQALVKNSGNYGFATVGKILQVISATKTDVFSTTSTSFVDITGLSVTITPKSTASKIEVSCCIMGDISVGSSFADFRFVRDSTPILIGDAAGSRGQASFGIDSYSSGGVSIKSGVGSGVDAPLTILPVTYKVQAKVYGGSSETLNINKNSYDSDVPSRTRYISTITAKEIGV